MSDEFDEQFASELLGAHVLAGVTKVGHSGEVQSQHQFHGRVVSASAKDGVTIVDAEGHEHWLPPDRASFAAAEPGDYHLRSTGEIVVDPNYVTTWTVHPPDEH